MKKKDYELIASVLKMHCGNAKSIQGINMWSSICEQFSITLASKNPRFDKEKFLKACGVEVEHYGQHTGYHCIGCVGVEK